MCYQHRNIPTNQAILNLSQTIGNISASDLDKTFILSNANLKFKASRRKLSREELLGLARKPTKCFVFRSSPVVPAMVAPPSAPAPVSRVSLNSRLSGAPTPVSRMRRLLQDWKRGRVFNERAVRPFG